MELEREHMNSANSYSGTIRRIDARLRSKYPHLRTRIFEVMVNDFQIQFDPAIQDALAISEDFDHSIRFIGVAATLTNEIPLTFVRELPTLTDSEATATMIGLPFSTSDLYNLLVSRFPYVGIVTVRARRGEYITICFRKRPPCESMLRLRAFINSLALPLEVRFDFEHSKEPTTLDSIPREPLYVIASRLRVNMPSYVLEDEAFWFNNIEAISTNQFHRRSFPGLATDSFRCFLDLTVGGNHLNLRQALLLYDEVWCSPPLAEFEDDFLRRQELRLGDLLQVVESGRLRFVTTQPEERLNYRFLSEVNELKPDAILGRRTTAALLLADLVNTAESSLLNDESMLLPMQKVAEALADQLSIAPRELLGCFLWPLASRRDALHGLFRLGTKGGPVFSLASTIAAQLQAKFDSDVLLETMMLSEPVHIAHAMDATLFGTIDEPPPFHALKSVLSKHLNFHRCFSLSLAKSWMDNETSDVSRETQIPAVPLFEFEVAIPIGEILADTALWSTRAKGRSLYARLIELAPEERQAEIDQLSFAFRASTRSLKSIVLDVANFGTSVAGLLGVPILSIFGLGRVDRTTLDGLRRIRVVDDMLLKLEEKIRSSRKQEIDFLSRINRIAAFRAKRV